MGVDPQRDRAKDARPSSRSTVCHTRTRRTASSAAHSRAAEKDGLLQPTIDFHFVKAGKTVEGDAAKEWLKDLKGQVATYNETPNADNFLELVDLAFRGAHSPDAETHDNSAVRAVYDWTLGVAHEALRRWIMGGHDAELDRRDGLDA